MEYDKEILEIPSLFKKFYTENEIDGFSINPKYDEQMENIVALLLASSKLKRNLIDMLFEKIIHLINSFLTKWWKKYRRLDFTQPELSKKLEIAINKLNYTPFEKEAYLVKFKLLHTMSEFLEVYEIIHRNKKLAPIMYRDMNQKARKELVDEFSDSFIAILLTAKRCGINLNQIHDQLVQKFVERNNIKQ